MKKGENSAVYAKKGAQFGSHVYAYMTALAYLLRVL